MENLNIPLGSDLLAPTQLHRDNLQADELGAVLEYLKHPRN